MSNTKLTKQDYEIALKIWQNYWECLNELSFPEYIEVKLDELEQPKTLMYRCIQVPSRNDGNFEIGKLYSENYCIAGFPLSDLPNHFELVKPEPEKITWEELLSWFETQEMFISNDLHALFNRIKTDHLL